MRKKKKISFPSEEFPEKLSFISSGQTPPDIYHVRSRLKEHFKNEPALQTFFAECDVNGELKNWSITNDTQTGDILYLEDLSQDEQEKLTKKCKYLEDEIRSWLGNVDNPKSHPDEAKLFNSLLTYPKSISLFAGTFDRGEYKKFFPVRIGWGCEISEDTASSLGVLEIDAGQNSETTDHGSLEKGPGEDQPLGEGFSVPEHPYLVKPSYYNFLWILNLILIAIIALWLIPACNIKLFGACDSEQTSFSPLITKISQLELQLTKEIKFCNGKPKDEEKTEVTEMEPERTPRSDLTEIDKRLKASNANYGNLNFTLAWNTRDDLDLFVTCPGGRKIGYKSKTQIENGCGSLDIDRNNKSVSGVVLDPIEHIIVSEASAGDKFSLEVSRHSRNGSTVSEVDFSLIVKSDHILEQFDGQVISTSDNWKAEYVYEAD